MPADVVADIIEDASTLVQAADAYRHILFLIVDRDPSLIARVLEHEDLLNSADEVLNAWRSHLGLDDGEADRVSL